jgi:hypothetical protein
MAKIRDYVIATRPWSFSMETTFGLFFVAALIMNRIVSL